MASQPKLGPVQLVYDGIEAIYSSEQRAELLRELDGQLRTWSKLPERADIRDLGWTVPSAELERRITFKV
jgi:hypothetical protein